MGHTYVSLSEGLWPEKAEGAADTSAIRGDEQDEQERRGVWSRHPLPITYKAQLRLHRAQVSSKVGLGSPTPKYQGNITPQLPHLELQKSLG